jgi:hypothetical protein
MFGETIIAQRLQATGLGEFAGRQGWRSLLGVVCLCLLTGIAPAAAAASQQFSVRNAKTELVDDVYRLDAELEYAFSKPALLALGNGVTLTLVLDIEVYRPRRYMWDEEVATLEQRYELQYLALGDQYLMRNLNSGSQFVYPTLSAALASIETIEHLPIIDLHLLDPKERYMVRVRSRLDIDALPVPLQMKAYVSSDWWLSSGWYSWDL